MTHNQQPRPFEFDTLEQFNIVLAIAIKEGLSTQEFNELAWKIL